MKTFALIGAAGYIAPRHMQAIKENGHALVAALDRSDSVGIIDSWFPDAAYFTEFERFDRHVDLRRRRDEGIDYVSICSPNYLHDSHMRFALRSGADAICEKPIVLNPWNIDGLQEVERDTGQRVHTILQLRLHPAVIALRERVMASPADRRFDVDLTYITSRGAWYLVSWKGEREKSGGIATNIGVHFYDMLQHVFGELRENVLHYDSPTAAAGYLEYAKARVRWFLSIDAAHLPPRALEAGMRTHRSLSIDGEEFEFSGGFGDLHTMSYREILAGRGFSLEENRVAVETVASIRTQSPRPDAGERHPLVEPLLTDAK